MTYGRAKTSAGSMCRASAHTWGVSQTSEDFTTDFLSCETLLPNSHSWSSKSDHCSTLGTEYTWPKYLVSGWGGFADASVTKVAGTVAVGVLIEEAANGLLSMIPFILLSFFSTLTLVASRGLSEAFGMDTWQGSHTLPFSLNGWEEDNFGNLLGKLSLTVTNFFKKSYNLSVNSKIMCTNLRKLVNMTEKIPIIEISI